MGYKDGRIGGNPVVRIACPMCGWIRTENYGVSKRTGEIRVVRFDKVDVEHAPILRMENMSGKGRGSGGTIELIDSKTLIELPEELKAQIKRQATRILTVLG